MTIKRVTGGALIPPHVKHFIRLAIFVKLAPSNPWKK